MALQQFFILSRRGDVLIKKEYRQDVQVNATESFFRRVVEDGAGPAFTCEGVNFFHLRRETIHLAVATLSNECCAGQLRLLLRIESALQDFCGTLSEDSVRKNFILIYEVLDEMVDFGFETLETGDQILPLVFETVDFGRELSRQGVFDRGHIKADQTLIPITDFAKRNDVFLDVVQSVRY